MILLTRGEMLKAAQKLAEIYDSVGNTRIDPAEKERLYGLAAKFPEVHYTALRLNNERDKP